MQTNPVEGTHEERVNAWFVENIDDVIPPLSFSLITGGRSNPTCRVEDAGQQVYVLRRPPLGHVLESAHNMGREYRNISAWRLAAISQGVYRRYLEGVMGSRTIMYRNTTGITFTSSANWRLKN